MQRKLTFILCLTFLVSCRSTPNMEEVLEEVSVIHQTFDRATTNVSINDMKEMGGKASQHHAKRRFHLYLASDSLFSLQSFSEFRLPINKAFVEKIDIDSLFTSLIKSFGTTIKVQLKTKTPSYQILSKESLKENKNYNGGLKFSRVIFNKSKTKACYYFEQSILLAPGREWDMGTVIFAVKKNGKWVYLKDECLFIS